MRIINGQYKGRVIKTIKDKSVRPTTNKTREAIFNIIEHNNLIPSGEYSKINYLEIYAGSAIMAFEFLSRGVKVATLIDQNPKLKKTFQSNAVILQKEEVNFIASDINKLYNNPRKYNFCFIDPPYSLKLEAATLNKLANENWLDYNAIIILETDKRNNFDLNQKYEVLLNKIYGRTRLIFLRYLG